MFRIVLAGKFISCAFFNIPIKSDEKEIYFHSITFSIKGIVLALI